MVRPPRVISPLGAPPRRCPLPPPRMASVASTGVQDTVDAMIPLERQPVTARPVRRGDADASDDVAVEEPLEIRISGESIAVTMRTPGDDLDLAVGFLFAE